ncbi:MAG: hypothetical protein ACF787_02315 [Rhodopirellula sp. JB053]|uniref:hypothetical protein n=1 Tax=Rhodopirellula sp. JB044 TaxID=3342844 RepID=UPI00370C08EB
MKPISIILLLLVFTSLLGCSDSNDPTIAPLPDISEEQLQNELEAERMERAEQANDD